MDMRGKLNDVSKEGRKQVEGKGLRRYFCKRLKKFRVLEEVLRADE